MGIKYITQPTYNISGQQGCCGAGTISRLRGRDCSESQRNSAILTWYESTEPHAIMSDLPGNKRRTMEQILAFTNLRPQAKAWKGRVQRASWNGGAVPVDIGFASVMEKALTHHKYAIMFMSDNVEGRGDYHAGAFSTRGLAHWITANDLGTIQSTGPVTSLRTQRQIQGWMFMPQWDMITAMVTKKRAELLHIYKELNSDKRIKASEEGRLKERASADKSVKKRLSSGWGGFTSGSGTSTVTRRA